jgi:ABC-2 type transport system permease protein
MSQVNDAGLLGRQLVAEQRSFWRNPLAAGFTFVFPIMFLIVFSSLNTGERLPELGNILFTEYYVPGIVTFAIVTACFTTLALNLTRQRDDGILKRKRGTPLPAWILIGGLIASSVIVSLLMTVITTVIGMVAYHNAAPSHLGWLVLVVVLGAATFCALGAAATSFIPNAEAGPAILNVLVFPLLFLSGAFFPVTNDTLNKVSNVFPVRPFQQSLIAAYDPAHTASAPTGRNLLVLVIWGAVAAFVAVRRFRWESRTQA